VLGLYRDLDSAVSTAMTERGLGLVQQAEVPSASSARAPGLRVYQCVTMRDTPVWLRVTWDGVRGDADGGAELGELVAGRTAQWFTWHACAGRFGDRGFESRLVGSVTGRLAVLEKQERRRR